MARFDLCGVDPDLPIRRRAYRAHHLKWNPRAFFQRAGLLELAAFGAQRQVLERRVGFVEDVGVHGMGHARHADAHFGGIDGHDVRQFVVEGGWPALSGGKKLALQIPYPQNQGRVEAEVHIDHLHLRHSPCRLLDLRRLGHGHRLIRLSCSGRRGGAAGAWAWRSTCKVIMRRRVSMWRRPSTPPCRSRSRVGCAPWRCPTPSNATSTRRPNTSARPSTRSTAPASPRRRRAWPMSWPAFIWNAATTTMPSSGTRPDISPR